MMKKGLVTALLCIAVWQGSQGSYIYAKAWLAQRLIADAWQQTLENNTPTKPWLWADTWPVARLHLREGNDLYVLSGAAGNSLAFGPGHDSASALPGQSGISVIGGHRDTHFIGLKELKMRDIISVQDKYGRWRKYYVDKMEVVDSRDKKLWIPQNNQTGISQLLLITCYPFDALQPGGAFRYVVSAVAISLE